MSFNVIARQLVRFSAVAVVVGALSGCQSIVGNQSVSQVRVIAASPDAPGLDIYQANAAIAYNLGFGTVTSYIPIDPGTYTITANHAGTKQVLSTSKATFVAFSQYTVLIGNSAASLQQTILKDQSQPAPSGQIALRLIDQATRIGGVDVYLVPPSIKITAVTPALTNVVFGTNTGYINVPSGTYTLVILPTGTIPTDATVPTYAGPQVTYSVGAARTVILIDQQLITTPGIQVITANDYDSPSAV